MAELIDDYPLLWDVLWQTTVFLGLGLAVSRRLAKRPARRHAALLLGITAAIVTPLVSVALRHGGFGLLAPLAAASGGGGALPAALTMETNRVAGAPGWQLGVAAVWATWTLVLIIRLVVSLACSRRLMSRATPIEDGPIRAAAVYAAGRLELRGAPEVSLSREVACPVIWCWGRRPRIVIPAGGIPGEPGLTAVLCHELAHWKRRDHLWNLAGELASCLLPWHPLLRPARRRLALLSEHSCDAWVVAAGASRTAFADVLVSLVPQRRAAWTVAALSTRRGFAGRIHRILDAPVDNPRHGGVWTVSMTLAVVGLATAAALAHRRAPAPPDASTPPAVRQLDPLVLVPTGPEIAADLDVVALPAELDTGIVAPGAVGSGSVWLINMSDETRTVHGAKASCGCTAIAAALPADLAPGAALELEITIKASTTPGERKSKNITIDIEGQAAIKVPVVVQAAAAD